MGVEGIELVTPFIPVVLIQDLHVIRIQTVWIQIILSVLIMNVWPVAKMHHAQRILIVEI